MSWLKDMVNIHIPVDELAEKLSMAGFEVESIDDLSSVASGVIVGFVEKVEPHPNADKLRICQVNVGDGERLQIVCGAFNVRSGIHVPVATVGTSLPSKGITIKNSELRGVKSNGMICSQEEIGLTTDEEGICILDNLNEPLPEVGESISELFGLNDTILELAITANRPDGMSMIGIAREIAALTEERLELPKDLNKATYENHDTDKFENNIFNDQCIYGLSLIEGLDGKLQSNKEIKSRITSAGLKCINAIVDITNYVMLEYGQPLHAFDADLLERLTNKNVSKNDFGLRLGKEGESFTALDGKKLNLNKNCTVVTCHDYPIAIAGVIGGKETAVTCTTKRIWLESAVFSPTSIRNTCRFIGLRTESSSRYEKGLPPEITITAANRYISLLDNHMKTDVKESWVYGNTIFKTNIIKLRRCRIDNLLGRIKTNINKNVTDIKDDLINQKMNNYSRQISDKEIESSLSLLGCELVKDGELWNVKVPPARKKDLYREVDLIEEIARLIGFDSFEEHLPDPIEPGLLNPKQKSERILREQLCASGLQEISTLSLVPKENNNKYIVGIQNPLLSETSHLRTNLWNEHVNVCKRNLKAGKKGCWIFEIGFIYKLINGSISQEPILGGIICGERRLELWSNSGKQSPLNYYQARGKLENSFNKFGLNIIDRRINTSVSHLHPGRSANLFLEGKDIGTFGELHPAYSEDNDLPKETYLFELKLNDILEAATRTNKWTIAFKEFSTIPFLERDIAFVVSKGCSSAEVIKTIRQAGKPLLEKVVLLDRYEGSQMKEGTSSQAYRLWFRSKEKTLTDLDVKPIQERIRKALIKNHSAELRS